MQYDFFIAFPVSPFLQSKIDAFRVDYLCNNKIICLILICCFLQIKRLLSKSLEIIIYINSKSKNANLPNYDIKYIIFILCLIYKVILDVCIFVYEDKYMYYL
jgi:hypothetical protein